MAYKLLLTENQSALGEAIHHALEAYPYNILCPPQELLRQRDPAALPNYLRQNHPGLVINTLALAGADDALSERLALGCREEEIACLHLSSYRVFGLAYCQGKGYVEADMPQPDDPEGRRLLQLERAFLEHPKSLVLRLPWLAEPRGDNIFTRVAARLASGQVLQVSDIHRGCPTTVDDVARVVVAMILQIFCGAENWGVFHLHTSDSCSEAEFADYLSRLLEKEGVTTGSTDIKRNPEERLIEGCGLLAGTRCTNNFGIQLRSWRHGLKAVLREWLEGERRQPNATKG